MCRSILPLMLFAVMLSAIWTLASYDAHADGAEIGVVKVVTGEVTLRRGTAAIPLVVGQSLAVGDVILTEADASVGFTLLDGAQFSIGPESAIELTAFDYKPQDGVLSLIANFLFGTMTHTTGEIGRADPEAVQIRTRLGVVGVRGTEFAVRAPKP